MPTTDDLVGSCLHQALADPARALVRLRLLVRDQQAVESGLDREKLRIQVKKTRKTLELGQGAANAHPFAALQAVDEYLAEAVDLGHAPQIRRLVLSPEEGEGEFLVIPRPSGWTSRLAAQQPGHPEYWLRHYQVLPTIHCGIGIRVKWVPRALAKLLDSASLDFTVGGFSDGVRPNWSSHSPYRCTCLENPAVRGESVMALLAEASQQRAAVVVLPELTVDASVRVQISRWLQERPEHPFALVVAGSFHEEAVDAGAATTLRRNVCRVLDRWGGELLVHLKLRPMRAMPKGQVADEDLSGGGQVELMLAPFGLIGVAICLDFCEIGDTPVTDLWRSAGPALMLVPSMGETATNHAHRDKARQLALQHGTATVVASQNAAGTKALGLSWSPGREGEDGRAIREGEQAPLLHGTIVWSRA